jgi:ABC-type sugar transport system ATPase subunit
MNFIDAVVDGTDAGKVTVRDAAGQAYEVSVDGSGISPGQEVTVGIRPEHLEVGGDKGHPVSVQSIEQLGGQSFLYCETPDGTQLTAHFVGQTSMRRGDKAHATFRRSFMHLFRKSDGKALKRLEIGEAAI